MAQSADRFNSYERAGKRAGIFVVLLLGAARAWIGRFSMDADGISYLDLSDAFRRHDWHGFVNAYWSPLYPMLLGISRMVLPTTKRWELVGAHLVNLLIFGAALAGFEFFYGELRRAQAINHSTPSDDLSPIPEWALWALAHALFLWVSLDLITLWGVSPDLCVSAFIYVIAGLILRFRSDPDWKLAAVLGAVLGGAYWAKAVMFPLAFAFMAIALFSRTSLKGAFRNSLIMATGFAAIAGPLVAAISLQKHRLTFGDSGRINYAMFVSPGGMTRNWQGDPDFGIQAPHPTRKLASEPPVYEFAEPIGGTFPVWYDPSYWEEGRVPRFNLKAQLAVVARNLASDLELLLHRENCLLAALATLLLVIRKDALSAIAANWPVLLICLTGMGIYVFVHTESRFVGAYVALLWLALFSPLRVSPKVARMSGYLLLAVAAALLISVLDETARAVRDGGPYSALQDVLLSDRLDAMGLDPAGRIAIVGGGGIYAARLSHLKIVCEVMGEDTPAFWRLTPEKRELVFQKFAESGARLVLAPDPGPALRVDPSWIKVDGVPFYVHWL
jgi:hypothetical protein